MPFAPFVPLRVLSSYSMLEGAIEPKAIAKLATERGFPAIATCDRNGLYGAVMVTGPEAEYWDDGFIAQYPNSGAFFEMIKDPDYQIAVQNRTAGLIDSRLVRFKPGEAGEGFG